MLMRGQHSIDCIALYALYVFEMSTVQNMSRILTKLYHVRINSLAIDFKPCKTIYDRVCVFGNDFLGKG